MPRLDLVGLRLWLARCIGAGFAAVVAKLLVLGLRARRMRRMIASVPIARYKSNALLGFFPDLTANRHRMNDWRDEISRGYPVCKMLGILGDPHGVGLIVRDPQAIKHFLKDNFDNYTKPAEGTLPLWYYFYAWLGAGLFTVRHGAGAPDGGHSWTRQRKISSAIFSRANFNSNMRDVFLRKAEKLRDVLAEPAERGERVDLQRHFFSFTMDSVMQIFFGEQADTLGGIPSPYGSAYDSAHESVVQYSIGAAPLLKLISLLPWPVGGAGGLLWRLREVGSPLQTAFRKACRTLDRESTRLVQACRCDPNLADRSDLLALFVKSEEEFSTQFLRDVVLNFIIAGRDTTACALSWMFYILATNPDVQAKLCEEVDAKCPKGSPLTFQQLRASEMPYLNGVLYETLRLHPPVPVDFKTCVRDDVFPDGTPVPADCLLFFAPYAMGRDPARYPDPLKVRPERWIPFAEPAPHEFPVFQAGPRICLGKDMAVFEAKLACCTLLQDYVFELAPGEAEKITYSCTLTMSVCNSPTQDSHNLWLIPKRRRL